jgi:hypothetical protein
MNIFIFKNEQQYGPYTPEQVWEYVQQGHFTLDDHACGDGQNWVPLSQIPGFASQVPAGQPQQPAEAQVARAGAQVAQAKVAGETGGGSKKKKIILFSSIGAVCLGAIITGLVLWLGGDDEKEDHLADKGKRETTENHQDEQEGDENARGSGTEDQTNEPKQPSRSTKTKSLADIPLLDRIPSDVLAVAFVDYGTILEKGGQGLLPLIPPDAPPQLTTVLKDPSTVGLDSSVPLQVVLSAYDSPGDDGQLGMAGKLDDAAKFKTVLGLLPGFEKPEEKDGYDLYVVPDTSLSCIGVAKDFFVLWNLDGGNVDKLNAEMEKFMHSDGSDSLAKSNDSFKAFIKQKHDAAIWANLEALTVLAQEYADGEVPDQFADTFEAGAGVVTLDFENGEAVLAGELELPAGFDRFGKGGLSDGALDLIPSKALAAFSLSLDMKAVTDYFENTLVSVAEEAGEEIDLDQVIPELGIKPRDVLEAFTGEISLALTEVSMEGGGPVAGEDPPNETEPQVDPFGGGEQPSAEVDPFGSSPVSGSIPSAGNTEGVPGMGGGLPVEFIAALSVDPANWEKLKAAPPLTMAMGLAMLQGISVTVKDDRLLVASKKHRAEAMEGSVTNKLSGSERSLFKDNDFALKLDLAEIAKLEDAPLPPPAMASLGKLSYLAITGGSNEKGSTGALRIGFADTQSNSLKSLLEIIPPLMMTLGNSMPAEVNF